MVDKQASIQLLRGLLGLIVSLLLLGGIRYFFPERSMTDIGQIAILNHLFAIGLLVLVVWISSALGVYLLRVLRVDDLSGLEWAVFSTSLGLGVLAYGVFFLGLMGLLTVEVIAGLLFFIGLATCREMDELRRRAWAWVIDFPRKWKIYKLDEKILFILSGLIFSLAFLQSLTPPWDYDGLLYHLQGPRLFLEAGRIYPVRDNWLLYYPFTPEMLFTLGLSFNCDYFAKLIHLSFAFVLVLSTYACAKRYLGESSAWLSAAILIGIPIFPIWASLAYGDMAWAVFEFLAVHAALIWTDTRKRRWLILAGVLMGFALGSKYMAFGGAAALGIWLVWKSRSLGWCSILVNGALFGGAALAVGAPWYLKNWIWTGDPIYPFLLSPGGEIGERVAIWTAYMNGFGGSRNISGYLLLPVFLYTKYQQFGTFMGSIEIPSLLFPLVIIYPFTRRIAALNTLAVWVVLRFVFWAVGVQQMRYLLPLFPPLSILAAFVLVWLTGKFPALLGSSVQRGLGFGVLSVTLVYSIIFFVDVRPLGVAIGLESKGGFLNRQNPQYRIIAEIKGEFKQDTRIFMLWDGRAYYCDNRCVPDIDHSFWPWMVGKSWDVNDVSELLNDRGATHLLVDFETAEFVAHFDRNGIQRRSQSFLVEDFMPACTRELDRVEKMILLELTCP